MSQHGTVKSQKPSDGNKHGPESTENRSIREQLATVQLSEENVRVVSSPNSSPSLSDERRFFVETSNYEIRYMSIKAISTIESVVETQKMGNNFNKGHDSTSENCSYEKEAKLVLLSYFPLDDIKIFVRTFSGKILDFDINPGETINNLKLKIQDKIGILSNQQRLTFGGDVLQDNRTLADYNIKSESILRLFMHLIQIIKIFIFTRSQKTFTLTVEPTETIEDIKLLIQEKMGIPADMMILYCKGEILTEHRTLSDYNIQKEAKIFADLRLRGGGMVILVKILTDECIELDVMPDETIKKVKLNIQGKKGIRPDQQLLLYAGKILEDGKELWADYNIGAGSMIILVLRSRCNTDVVKVFIEGVAGKIITLHCTVNETVEEMKEYIQKYQDDAPKERQRLFYKGKELEDENRCFFYNIVNNSTVLLYMRPQYGMQIKVIMPNTTTDRPVLLEVLRDETIAAIKGKISPWLGCSQEYIFIAFEGKIIQDEFKPLLHYNIHHKSTISVAYSFHYEIKIQVMKSFGPEQHEMIVKVKPNDTVKKLKWKIHGSEGIPPDQQLLIFKAQKLDDDNTLYDYEIEENSCVHACKSTGNKTTYVVNCSLNGEETYFEVSGAMTIESILTKIQARNENSFYSSPYIKLGVKHL